MKPVTFDDIDVTIVRARRDLWVAVAGETVSPDTQLAAQGDNPPPYTGKGEDPNAALDDLRERWTAWMGAS